MLIVTDAKPRACLEVTTSEIRSILLRRFAVKLSDDVVTFTADMLTANAIMGAGVRAELLRIVKAAERLKEASNR